MNTNRSPTEKNYTNIKNAMKNKRSFLNSIKFNKDLLNLKDKENLLLDEENEIDEGNIENKKLMVKVMRSGKIYDMLNEFVLNENRDLHHDSSIFLKTRYVSHDSHLEFYEKYRKFNEKFRKGQVKINTPSFAFIKAANDQMLIPNPLGLIKRKGDESQINLKNQNVGDEYLKALSKGLKYSDNINELNLAHNRLTFNGVNSLINSIHENPKLLKNLKILDLSYNKIGVDSINKLIKFIQEEECELRELNLEGNSLGDKIIQSLCENLNKYISDKLVFLNLGKNLITDDSAYSLANILQFCLNLQVLIISWNNLKILGASLIINKLRKHYQIKVFDISWNSIGNNLNTEPTFEEIHKVTKPGRAFYNYEVNEFRTTMSVAFKKLPQIVIKEDKKISKNTNTKLGKNTIKSNNASSNNLIKNNSNNMIFRNISAFAKELGELFKEKEIELIHLDISHNNISYEDAIHLSDCVKSNHTILGLHVDGNEMCIDSLGFIHPIKKLNKEQDYYANSQIYYGIGKENGIIKSNVDKIRKIKAKNNCWICEGWSEKEIKYKPIIDIVDPSIHHVKLHLNIDDWKAFDTIFSNNHFFNTRMCPPGEVQYFFSCGKQIVDNYESNTTVLKKDFIFEFDDEFNKEFNNLQLMNAYNKTQLGEDYLGTKTNFDDNPQNINFTGNNLFQNSPSTNNNSNTIYNQNLFKIKTVGSLHSEINNNVIDEYYRKTLKYCEPRPERTFNKFVKPRTPWSFPISIWTYYDYKFEGDSDESIDEVFEFDFARCYGKDKEDLKPIIKPHYRKILNSYKILSSQMGSSVWQINQTSLTEFVNSCPGLLDSTYVINDVFVKEREVKAADKMEKAKNKLKTTPDNLIRHQFLNLIVKVASDKYVRTKIYNLIDAVAFSMKNHYLPYFEKINDNHIWRKERYYVEQVDNFFKSHLPILDAVFKSWAVKEPGKKDVWMVLDGFTDLMIRLIDTESFPVRDFPIVFNVSIKLQIDEISTERLFKMQFYEFLEALARVVDKAYPVPNGPGDKLDPLINKLENVVPFLIKSITNPEYKFIKEKFPLPSKEQGTGLYVYDTTNLFYQGFELSPKTKK